MTSEQLLLFVYRLQRREVTTQELARLSVDDLIAINIYLLENRKAHGLDYRNEGFVNEGFVYGSMVISEGLKRTYSEEEILAEFGITA
jgi:hypothetical protein